MKKWSGWLLLSLFSLPVFASDWGVWESFSISPAENNGHWICGMDSVSRTVQSRDVSIKLIEATPFIQFDIHDSSWSFPQGTSVPVSLDFDDNEPLDLVAYGDGEIVSIAIPVELTATFLSLVNDKKRIRLFFSEDREQFWTIDLDGAGNAISGMLSCYQKYKPVLK